MLPSLLNKGAEQKVTAYNNNFEKLANFMKICRACEITEIPNVKFGSCLHTNLLDPGEEE